MVSPGGRRRDSAGPGGVQQGDLGPEPLAIPAEPDFGPVRGAGAVATEMLQALALARGDGDAGVEVIALQARAELSREGDVGAPVRGGVADASGGASGVGVEGEGALDSGGAQVGEGGRALGERVAAVVGAVGLAVGVLPQVDAAAPEQLADADAGVEGDVEDVLVRGGREGEEAQVGVRGRAMEDAVGDQ